MPLKSVLRALVLLFWLVALSLASQAETLFSRNIDSRVLVGLKADPSAVQSFLPEGWSSVPFPAGPLKGADLLLALIDGELEMDAEGKPLDPASRRAAVLVGLGKQGDAVRMFVLSMLTTVPERDPYGVGSVAEIERTSTVSGPPNADRRSSDEWRISPESGGEIVFTLTYTSGKRGWSPGELFPHSASNPEFSRIYRYRQMIDLVASEALGKASSGEFSLTNSSAEWAEVLGGDVEIVAVMDVPVYVRDVYLP